MKIGIFGGSFDPIHLGHLWIAEAAHESLALNQIRWIPAATSPLKLHGPTASNEDRIEMLRLAISGSARDVIDDREIRRGGVSYTVDTIAELKNETPEAEFVMLIGSDSLHSMRLWQSPERLLQMVIPAVVQRGGDPPIDFSVLEGLVEPSRIELFRDYVVAMPLIELSSGELRQRIASGRSIRYRVPRSVEAMIHSKGIYRGK